MIKVSLTDGDFEYAKRCSDEMGALRNSITFGDGNMAGFLGEAAAARFLGADIVHTHDYDLEYNGMTIDVKTKRTTREFVNRGFEASIAAINNRQKCDAYVFVRVNIERRVAWLCGWKGKLDYFIDARFVAAGSMDGSNGWRASADCLNMKYSDLNDMETLRCRPSP
jgi:hypothetical protein